MVIAYAVIVGDRTVAIYNRRNVALRHFNSAKIGDIIREFDPDEMFRVFDRVKELRNYLCSEKFFKDDRKDVLRRLD